MHLCLPHCVVGERANLLPHTIWMLLRKSIGALACKLQLKRKIRAVSILHLQPLYMERGPLVLGARGSCTARPPSGPGLAGLQYYLSRLAGLYRALLSSTPTACAYLIKYNPALRVRPHALFSLDRRLCLRVGPHG